MIKLKHVSLGNRWDVDCARGKVEDFEHSLIFPPVQMYKERKGNMYTFSRRKSQIKRQGLWFCFQKF